MPIILVRYLCFLDTDQLLCTAPVMGSKRTARLKTDSWAHLSGQSAYAESPASAGIISSQDGSVEFLRTTAKRSWPGGTVQVAQSARSLATGRSLRSAFVRFGAIDGSLGSIVPGRLSRDRARTTSGWAGFRKSMTLALTRLRSLGCGFSSLSA